MSKKKNIIFICTDQHRVDTFSFYKQDTICQTPVLDRLAQESVIFDNAYTSCPVCTPARGSMQTGLYPSKTGMETNSYQTGCRTHELCDVPFLLNRRLESVGYNCGYTGKWHLALVRTRPLPKRAEPCWEFWIRAFWMWPPTSEEAPFPQSWATSVTISPDTAAAAGNSLNIWTTSRKTT